MRTLQCEACLQTRVGGGRIVGPWRMHDLRHAMATHWLASGINAKIVSERLGHASVAFTRQVYAHALPNQQADVAERIARELLRSSDGN